MRLVIQHEQLDLRVVHLADRSLVDFLVGDMLEQDIAQDIVARRLQPVARLGFLIQSPLRAPPWRAA